MNRVVNHRTHSKRIGYARPAGEIPEIPMPSPRRRRRLLTAAIAFVAVVASQFLVQVPTYATLMYDQGGFAARYGQDGSLQLFNIQFHTGSPSQLYHYYSPDGSTLYWENMNVGLPIGESGFASAINYGSSLQVFFKSGGALVRKYYNAGSWTTETITGSGVNSSPATATDGSTMHTAYVTTSGAVVDRWNSGGGWSSQTVFVSGCSGSRTPAMGNFNGQLHILARCYGSWAHFWKDPGGSWNNELLGQSTFPGSGDIALSTGGGEFDVVGNATDGTLWRWWYVDGVGWREQQIVNAGATGRIQVGWFYGSLHVAWSSGTNVHNSWINGSSWSDQSLTCLGSCSQADAVALGTSYFLVSTDNPYSRWRWTPSGGWLRFDN